MSGYSYKNLIVWQKSIELIKQLYVLSDLLPRSEDYNLKSQIRRATLSVSSNIAEGSARMSSADQKRFYTMARSSLIELDSQMEAGIALNYFNRTDCQESVNISLEIYKILSKLIGMSSSLT